MTNARTVHCADHSRQVGCCAACQRARLAAERQQLAEVLALTAGGSRTRGAAAGDEQADRLFAGNASR